MTSHHSSTQSPVSSSASESAPQTSVLWPSSGSQGGVWRMVLAMGLSGTIGLLVVESGLPTLWVVWLRCILGGLGLLVWVWGTRLWLRPTRGESVWLLLGGAALILNWLCLFKAYHYSGIAVATVVYHVQPFLLLLLAAVLQGEPVPTRRLPWLFMALLGVVLSSGWLGAGDARHMQWQGMALALLAASLYALATLATQRLRRLAPAQIAMLQMAVGVIILLPGAWIQHGDAHLTLRAWGAVLVLGVVHTAWMYVLMYTAFQRLPAQAIAGLSFIYPVMALLVDVGWFGTQPSPVQWCGMAVILGAVWMYRRSDHSVRKS